MDVLEVWLREVVWKGKSNFVTREALRDYDFLAESLDILDPTLLSYNRSAPSKTQVEEAIFYILSQQYEIRENEVVKADVDYLGKLLLTSAFLSERRQDVIVDTCRLLSESDQKKVADMIQKITSSWSKRAQKRDLEDEIEDDEEEKENCDEDEASDSFDETSEDIKIKEIQRENQELKKKIKECEEKSRNENSKRRRLLDHCNKNDDRFSAREEENFREIRILEKRLREKEDEGKRVRLENERSLRERDSKYQDQVEMLRITAAEVQDLRMTNVKLRNRIEECEVYTSKFREQVKLKQELEEKLKRINQDCVRWESEKQQLEVFREKFLDADSKIVELQQRILSQQILLDEKKNLDLEKATIEEALRNAEEVLKMRETTSKSGYKEEVEVFTPALQEKMLTLELENQKLRESTSDTNRSLVCDLESHRNQVKKLQQQLQTDEIKYRELEKKNRDKENEIIEMKNEIIVSMEEKDCLKKLCEKLENELEDIVKKKLPEEVEKVRKERKEVESELEDVLSELEQEKERRRVQHEKMLLAVKGKSDEELLTQKLHRDKAQLQRTIDEITEKYDSLKASLSRSLDRIGSTSGKCLEVESENRQYSKECELLKLRLCKISTNVEEMEKKLAEYREKLRSKMEEKEELIENLDVICRQNCEFEKQLEIGERLQVAYLKNLQNHVNGVDLRTWILESPILDIKEDEEFFRVTLVTNHSLLDNHSLDEDAVLASRASTVLLEYRETTRQLRREVRESRERLINETRKLQKSEAHVLELGQKVDNLLAALVKLEAREQVL